MAAGKARQREMSVPDLVIAKLTTTALASSPVCGQSASADSSSPPPTQSDVATANAEAKFLARVY